MFLQRCFMMLHLFVLTTFKKKKKKLYSVLKTLIDHYSKSSTLTLLQFYLKQKYIGKCGKLTPISPYAEAGITKKKKKKKDFTLKVNYL